MSDAELFLVEVFNTVGETGNTYLAWEIGAKLGFSKVQSGDLHSQLVREQKAHGLLGRGDASGSLTPAGRNEARRLIAKAKKQPMASNTDPMEFDLTAKGIRKIFVTIESHPPPQPGRTNDHWVDAPIEGNVVVSLIQLADQLEPSATFKDQRFQSEPASFEINLESSGGLGNNVNIKVKLNFDAISTSISNLGPYKLIPGNAGVLRIIPSNQTTHLIYPKTWTVNISGEYTVTGPTETKKKRFSKPRTIYGTNGSIWSLNTSRYPVGISLAGTHLVQWHSSSGAQYLIEEVVDGVSILITSGGEHWHFPEATETPAPVRWSAKAWPAAPASVAPNTYIVENLHQHTENKISMDGAQINAPVQLAPGSVASHQASTIAAPVAPTKTWSDLLTTWYGIITTAVAIGLTWYGLHLEFGVWFFGAKWTHR